MKNDEIIEALNFIDELASQTSAENHEGEAEEQAKKYNLVFNYIKYKEEQDKKAFDIVSNLMSLIENDQPEYYSSSDLILSADDLLKELEGQREECENKDSNGNACYNCEAGFGGCGESTE